MPMTTKTTPMTKPAIRSAKRKLGVSLTTHKNANKIHWSTPLRIFKTLPNHLHPLTYAFFYTFFFFCWTPLHVDIHVYVVHFHILCGFYADSRLLFIFRILLPSRMARSPLRCWQWQCDCSIKMRIIRDICLVMQTLGNVSYTSLNNKYKYYTYQYTCENTVVWEFLMRACRWGCEGFFVLLFIFEVWEQRKCAR